MKSFVLTPLIVLSLAGCAKINDAGMRLLSSSAPAVAVMNDTLLTGQAVVFADRTGTLSLESGTEPKLKCMGHLHYTASKTGVARLNCSDGTDVQMSFTAISETTGYGSGRTARGPVSYAFGMPAADATAYLALPPGKRIVALPEGAARLEPL